ncbi:MAG: TIGR00341 family protein, partial [Halobacterium sp.]
MRLVQVTVPTGKREAVLDALDDEGIDYVVTDETSGREYTAVVHFPIPTEGVEDALDALRSAGLSEDAYTVVLSAETVVSRHFDELKERYAEEEENGDQ